MNITTDDMTALHKKDLRERVEAFVAGLGGACRSHCSDQFLTEVLLMRLQEVFRLPSRCSPYEAVIPVFETILEGACGVTFNGHHIAQAFVEKIFPKQQDHD